MSPAHVSSISFVSQSIGSFPCVTPSATNANLPPEHIGGCSPVAIPHSYQAILVRSLYSRAIQNGIAVRSTRVVTGGTVNAAEDDTDKPNTDGDTDGDAERTGVAGASVGVMTGALVGAIENEAQRQSLLASLYEMLITKKY